MVNEVAIVTLFDYINIGNKLQNYALQEVIKENSYEPITLACSDFYYTNNLKRKLKNILGHVIPKYKTETMIFKRRNIIKLATSELILSTKDCSLADLKKNHANYSAYIVGSDQVWKDWGENEGELEFRFLKFVPEKKRICYAPSFGFDKVPNGMEIIYQDGLQGFETLSCREQSGCDIIKSITRKHAELLCDPTMLLTVDEWKKISQQPKYCISEKYVLIYYLGEMTNKQKQLIEEYSSMRGFTIVDIYNSSIPKYYNTTPQEFLYLVEHALYIFTDSFHGTVFSILYNKKFTCFVREGEYAKMNNRVTTLLQKFCLTDRINQVVDFSFEEANVNTIIEQERLKGKKYIKSELLRATQV